MIRAGSRNGLWVPSLRILIFLHFLRFSSFSETVEILLFLEGSTGGTSRPGTRGAHFVFLVPPVFHGNALFPKSVKLGKKNVFCRIPTHNALKSHRQEGPGRPRDFWNFHAVARGKRHIPALVLPPFCKAEIRRHFVQLLLARF